MLRITRHTQAASNLYGTLTLPFDIRQKSRFRAQLDNGEEVAVVLPRGRVLRDGDLLEAESGQVVQVIAAAEQVSTVHTSDPLAFAKACYHLGNRHVPLQIDAQWLRYGHDHVLDDMVSALGLSVQVEQAPFEPESGAYHSHAGHHHQHAE